MYTVKYSQILMWQIYLFLAHPKHHYIPDDANNVESSNCYAYDFVCTKCGMVFCKFGDI